jgi:DNA replication protein DnaC
LEQIDYTFERGLDRNQVERLAAMDFVRDRRDLFVIGPTGTGKSYLATALGNKACQEGFRVMYANTNKLIAALKISKAKGTILNELKRIERADLLILDDFGMQTLDPQARGIMMDIIED